MCSRNHCNRKVDPVGQQQQQQQRRQPAAVVGTDSTVGIVLVEGSLAVAHFENFGMLDHFVVMLVPVVEYLQSAEMEIGLGFVATVVFLDPAVVAGNNCNRPLELGKGIDQPFRIEVERMGKIVGRNVHSMA